MLIKLLNIDGKATKHVISWLKTIGRPLLTIVFLVLFVNYFINNRNDFSILATVNPGLMALVLLGLLLVLLSNVGVFIFIVKAAGKQFNVYESIQVTIYSSIINFFGFFQTGLGYRGIYLKREHNVSYKFYSTITFLQYLITFAFALTVGAFAYSLISSFNILPLVIFLVIFLVVFKKHPRLIAENSRLRALFSLGFSKTDFFWMTLLAMLQFFGLALAFGAELIAVGAEFSLAALILFTSIVIFSLIFAITPGAIGIREAMLLIAASQMSIDTQDIILGSTIDRLMYSLILISFIPFTWAWKRKNRYLRSR